MAFVLTSTREADDRVVLAVLRNPLAEAVLALDNLEIVVLDRRMRYSEDGPRRLVAEGCSDCVGEGICFFE